MSSIDVIHTIGSLGAKAGGPTRTVRSLCVHVQQADRAIQTQIATTQAGKFGPNVIIEDVPIVAMGHRGSRSEQIRNITQIIGGGNYERKTTDLLLHDHGQWLGINRASAEVARRMEIKRIVTPRGMLTPWALSQRRIKKLVAWNWFARKDIQQADVIHATSQLEADELRDLGLVQPIAIIPNGVDIWNPHRQTHQKTKTALFMSRIHPKKGVKELVKAWRQLSPKGWNLKLAGPDESDIIASLALSNEDSISYVGEVEGDVKWNLLSEASLFVLPSYSENFGVVVVESLMAGTPVIATHGTPWRKLVDHGCGWWIPMTNESLICTLDESTKCSEETLRKMGERGRQLAINDFGWNFVGEEMASVYRWICGHCEAPGCVQFT